MINIESGSCSKGRSEFFLKVSGRHYDIYFQGEGVSGSAEALVPLVLLAAMRSKQNIQVGESCSPTFMTNMRSLSNILSKWFLPEGFHPVSIDADELKVPVSIDGRRVASFFTGGVDSFYTFLKHQDEITDLIYVHGFDLPLEETAKRRAVSEMGKRIEQATGVRFLEIETNSRRVLRDWGRWGTHGHGLGLGCIGRLLASEFNRIYIPSSFHQSDLFPWSSHPETDVLYSDESMEFVHDGCEAFRAQKIEFISGFPVALDNLRVCGEKDQLDLNCGRCEKCVRTMTSLYSCGVLGQAKTFLEPLTKDLVRKQIIYDPSIVAFVKENLALMEKNCLESSDIYIAWDSVLRRSGLENKLRRKIYKFRRKLGL